MHETQEASDSIEARQRRAYEELGLPECVISAIFAPTHHPDDGSAAAQSVDNNHDRYVPLSDEEYDTISAQLTDAAQARTSLRDFLNGLLWSIANEKLWASIPERYGDGDALRQRFRRMSVKSDGLMSLADRVKGKLSTQRQAQIKSLSHRATVIARRAAQQKANKKR